MDARRRHGPIATGPSCSSKAALRDREHRFKDAWTLTIYKSAVETLTAEEMEDLRPDFEERAAKIPDQVEITGEQINGNVATVFVKVPNDVDVAQTISEPVALFSSGNSWIIGTEENQATVKKVGRRYFLDGVHPLYGLEVLFCCWLLVGQRFEVGVGGGRKRLTILGAYCPDDHEYLDRRYTDKNLNAQSLIELFTLMMARHPETKLFRIYLDNARYQHAVLLKAWIA